MKHVSEENRFRDVETTEEQMIIEKFIHLNPG